jgi:protein-S-isoprenylcysteine O-methyltransferase Ste14
MKTPISNKVANSFLQSFKGLFGVGLYLLLIGFVLELLTIVLRRWVSFPFSIAVGMQIGLSVTCILIALIGIVWFNISLNLVKVHFRGGEYKLISQGLYNYVRHPLYTILLITLPPLLMIWYQDWLFIMPWLLIFVFAHFVVAIEERGLVKSFDEDYKMYQRHVPPLLPYKGAGGRRYRQHQGEKLLS